MELVNPGQDTAFAFVLVWTLFYGTSFLPFQYPQTPNSPVSSTGIVHGKQMLTCVLICINSMHFDYSIRLTRIATLIME